ncbi:hypothetical protein DY000_02052140 [Brassica cretica]|uniref:Transposase-associated domain-containing protein n=1 Tax=Brassica cretica TaxID=69181 RepID=A0ABQ7AAX2_BRACR|nr:hypothetical protein DY000_02052140 [Brassica cretica]
MSSSNYYRSWIDRPHLDPNTRLLTEEYQRGITEFMGLVQRQPEAETGMLRCPCSNCKNRKIIKEWDVWTHLYLNGFTRSYKIWYHHGETDYEYGSTSEPQPAVSHLQTYLLTNCEDVLQYERIFMAEKRFEYRYATEEELEELKQREFSGWMLTYVSASMTIGETFDDWIREMVRGPEYVVKSYTRFCTRGYAFTTQKRRHSSTTYDASVCSASGDDVYYGNIREIMEINYS